MALELVLPSKRLFGSDIP